MTHPETGNRSDDRPVPTPDFTPIVEERRSPLLAVLSILAAVVAVVLFFVATP